MAQTCAIEGDVKDEHGQLFKHVQIVIDREDAKSQFHGATDNKGHYYYGGLQPGNYTVSVVVDEKARTSMRNIRIALGNPTQVNFDLGAATATPEKIAPTAENSTPATRLTEQLMRAALILARLKKGVQQVKIRFK